MKKLTILIFAIILSSCSSPATKQGMVVTDYESPKTIGENIIVKESIGGSKTLPFWTSEISNNHFTEAVKESLINSKLFSAISKDWESDWELTIQINSVDQPVVGIGLTVRTNVEYALYLKGKEIFRTNIQQSGVANIGDSIIAVKRLRLANERSAKNNIRAFLEEISSKDLNQNTSIK